MAKDNNSAKWEINCDGWYPYCTACQYEPARNEELECTCPSCGAKMENWQRFERLNK